MLKGNLLPLFPNKKEFSCPSYYVYKKSFTIIRIVVAVLNKSQRKFHNHQNIKIFHTIYRVSQEECARLREGVPYVKLYRYNPKHICPKLNGYGDNGQ